MAQHTGSLRLIAAGETNPEVQIQVIPYRPKWKIIWDDLVQRSVNGTFLHRRDFMEYHGNRFEDASLIVIRADKPVAIFPAERAGNTIYSHRGLTYAGWIHTADVSPAELYPIIVTTLAYFRNIGIQQVDVKTVPECFAYTPQQPLLAACLSAGAYLKATYTHHATPLPYRIADRGKIWGRKKALAYGLCVRQSEDWGYYWEHILCPNLRSRHGVSPTHSLPEITLLRDRFPDNIRLFGVYQGDRMLGGCVVFDTLRCAHLQYTAATEMGKSLRCLDLLLSHLIEDAFNDREYINFGVSHMPETGELNEGLVKWKESFGAQQLNAFKFRFKLPQWSTRSLLIT